MNAWLNNHIFYNFQVLTFDVVTCNDAHVLLAKYFKNMNPSESYEVVFGCSGNSKLEIRDGAGVTNPSPIYVTLKLIMCITGCSVGAYI
jgi:hypothetical protein